MGREAAVVMSTDCECCGGVAFEFSSFRAREGGSVEVILLMVARQLIVMCDLYPVL